MPTSAPSRAPRALRQQLPELARRAAKPVWAIADLAARPPSGVVVLLYHRVGAGTASEVDLPLDLFAAQADELAATGRVVALDEALRYLAGSSGSPSANPSGAPPPAPPIVITFDDGTGDFVDHALPLLAERELPATLYVATRWLDDAVPFWGDGAPLTWSALREAASTGLVTVGSHTHTHALLDRLAPAALAAELDTSIGRIGAETGQAPAHFAYPKALAPTPAADVAVRARFVSAALAGTRPNRPGTDPYRLTRSPVQRSDGLRWWRRKLAGGMGAEDRFRERINRRRYGHADR